MPPKKRGAAASLDSNERQSAAAASSAESEAIQWVWKCKPEEENNVHIVCNKLKAGTQCTRADLLRLGSKFLTELLNTADERDSSGVFHRALPDSAFNDVDSFTEFWSHVFQPHPYPTPSSASTVALCLSHLHAADALDLLSHQVANDARKHLEEFESQQHLRAHLQSLPLTQQLRMSSTYGSAALQYLSCYTALQHYIKERTEIPTHDVMKSCWSTWMDMLSRSTIPSVNPAIQLPYGYALNAQNFQCDFQDPNGVWRPSFVDNASINKLWIRHYGHLSESAEEIERGSPRIQRAGSHTSHQQFA